MLLSLSHNFLFVHVPKTGGSSIRHALIPYSIPKNEGVFRRFSSNLPFREAPQNVRLRIHDTAAWARLKLGTKTFEELLSFAVVRNPYTRAISYFEYLRQNPKHPQNRVVRNMSFEKYLIWGGQKAKQSKHLCDLSGNLLVDRVLRFENMAEEFQSICRDIGVSVELPRINISAQMSLTEYLTPEACELIEQIYTQDFELFKYPKTISSLLGNARG
ncbi:MAG: sulfotransferase family 2 domain-containing protein [Rhizobiaceae bacterium]